MSELRESIADLAIEYTICYGLVDELESLAGWNEETDIGLHRAVAVAHSEAEDARRRLMGLVRILLNQEVNNV